jgi:hypothetical protein
MKAQKSVDYYVLFFRDFLLLQQMEINYVIPRLTALEELQSPPASCLCGVPRISPVQ